MNENKLVGAWSLFSSVQSRNGIASKTFGDPPSGQIQYTNDGRMSAFLMDPCWKKEGVNASKQADLFFSYAGQWEVKGDEIHHFVEFCSAPSKIGTTFVRSIRFINENELELSTAPETSPSGNVYETKLIWKRFS
ncbi:lipocalin-like domain-containing protein [Amphritea japonica]|uniref:Lipocalin-like domain-containing protein n=1 Tax=Amphritea japonica ATCC BAA-1530 TaxID=1278309 RepID=A0A7R6PH18_9GAMM|nr:lipocalin-like domain-containing protein [Amphritea japonica]BBB26337.1 conserved hypothetical protein [Amphritea japonica ATCC BAA-1530]